MISISIVVILRNDSINILYYFEVGEIKSLKEEVELRYIW